MVRGNNPLRNAQAGAASRPVICEQPAFDYFTLIS
jgi:hypothetical protein